MKVEIKKLDSIAMNLCLKYEVYEGIGTVNFKQDEFVIELGKIFNELVGEIDFASLSDVTEANKCMAYIFARMNMHTIEGSFINQSFFLRYYKYYYSETMNFVKMNKVVR